MIISTWFCSSGFGPWAVGRDRGGGRRERVGRPGDEKAEEEAHRHHGGERVGEVVLVAATLQHGDTRQVDPEHQAPEQDRALERRPQRHHGDDRRRRARADLRHVGDREVVAQERHFHQQVREPASRREKPSARRRVHTRPTADRVLPATKPTGEPMAQSSRARRTRPCPSDGIIRRWPRPRLRGRGSASARGCRGFRRRRALGTRCRA